MSTFVLVHGAFHGAWCWYKVKPLLQDRGHNVVTPDLPASGVDRTPLHSVSLQHYADRVCEALQACTEPAYLVGHSMGGLAITQAAELMPNRVKMLVYLTALLLPNGQSSLELLQSGPEASTLLPKFVFSADQASITVRPDAVQEVFYADCSPADIALAESLLAPQAVAPLATPIHTSGANWGSVPRAYIECTADHTLSVATQQAMYSQVPCQTVMTLPTGHSSFLSAPKALAQHLLSL